MEGFFFPNQFFDIQSFLHTVMDSICIKILQEKLYYHMNSTIIYTQKKNSNMIHYL